MTPPSCFPSRPPPHCARRLRGADSATTPPPVGNRQRRARPRKAGSRSTRPGFDLKINIPEGIRRDAEIDDDNGVIYPGSTLSGMHVEGGPDRADGEGDGEVEIRFTSRRRRPGRAWYRIRPAASSFTIPVRQPARARPSSSPAPAAMTTIVHAST